MGILALLNAVGESECFEPDEDCAKRSKAYGMHPKERQQGRNTLHTTTAIANTMTETRRATTRQTHSQTGYARKRHGLRATITKPKQRQKNASGHMVH